jgi:hypothetical protein
MEFSLQIDPHQWREVENLLHGIPGGVRKAAFRAIKNVLKMARHREARAITQTYTVSLKTARLALTTKEPRLHQVEIKGAVIARGKGVPLVEFQHKPRTLSHALRRRPKHGVAVRIFRKGGYRQIAGTFKERGRQTGRLFIGWRAMRGGRQVGRYPVHMLYGPSLPSMAEKVLPDIEDEIAKRLRERFLHEAEHLIWKALK